VREAQRLGLSRNRWGRPAQLALQVGALLPAAVAAAAVAPADSDKGAVLGVGAALWVGLTALTQRLNRQRDTASGRAAAARWLGLRDHLGRDEAFGTLPPAAVAIWDRYLGYGAAMGVAGTASRVLAFGAQDERLAWSAYGGSWHRVRIRYPGSRLVEGRHPVIAGLLGGVAVLAGYYGVRLFGGVRGSLEDGSGSARWVLFGLTAVSLPSPPTASRPRGRWPDRGQGAAVATAAGSPGLHQSAGAAASTRHEGLMLGARPGLHGRRPGRPGRLLPRAPARPGRGTRPGCAAPARPVPRAR
jgi:hypothetical protein